MSAPEQETLEQRLRRFPPDRYPVQHATAQFHNGVALLHGGSNQDALCALETAQEGFGAVGLALERAKCTSMLGVALRGAGRLEEAAVACTDAAGAFGALQAPAEQAAALYNLGLVRLDAGRSAEARAAWAVAQQLFTAAGHPGPAAAAARDSGAALLTDGDAAAARPLLEQAVALAERAGDAAGAGAASNVLGLACLAGDDVPAAVAALRRARAASPIGLRPAELAMATANLALAYEQAGLGPRARLAARQVLAVRGAAGPVRRQARDLLERSDGDPAEDLAAALEQEPPDGWAGLLREELLRALELPPSARTAALCDVLSVLLGAPEQAYDLGESLLSALLEQPPRSYDALLTALVQACAELAETDRERVQTVLASSLARFAMPQWQRTVAGLNAAARAAGQPESWR